VSGQLATAVSVNQLQLQLENYPGIHKNESFVTVSLSDSRGQANPLGRPHRVSYPVNYYINQGLASPQ